jgi:hypothetical protein
LILEHRKRVHPKATRLGGGRGFLLSHVLLFSYRYLSRNPGPLLLRGWSIPRNPLIGNLSLFPVTLLAMSSTVDVVTS